MEALRSETSNLTIPSFSGAAELRPKKRALDRGKAVLDESSPKKSLEIDLNSLKSPSIPFGIAEIAPAKLSDQEPQNALLNQEPQNALPDQEPQKALPDQEPQKALPDQATPKAETESENQQSDKPLNFFLHLRKGEKEASSNNPHRLPTPPPTSSPPPPSSPPKNSIECKFCGQKFSTSQALGGHQNAHKQEREMQRAMKAAQENPFGSHMPSTRMTSLFHGSHYGNHSPYSPYQAYAPGGWQTRPVYTNPRMGLLQGSPTFSQGLVHYQPTLAQGHVQYQPRLAQGLFQGRPNLAQGLVQGRPSLAQGLVQGRPSLAQGLVHSQPSLLQGFVHGQPSPTRGAVHGQPSHVQGVVHGQSIFNGQPSHAQSSDHNQPSLTRGFIGNSSMTPASFTYNPGWPTPYVGPSGLVRADGFTNLNHFGTSNLTKFMQARENEGNLAKKQRVGSIGPGLSLNGNQPEEANSLKNPHESIKLDLDLKL